MNAIIQKPLEFIARELDFRNDFKGRRTCDSEFKLTDVPLAIGNGVLYSSKLVYRLGGLGAAIGAVYGAATGDFDMDTVKTGWAYGTMADVTQISIRGGIKFAQIVYNRYLGSNQQY